MLKNQSGLQMKNLCLLAIVLLLWSCAEKNKNIIELYQAGFKTIKTTDKSRIYKPSTDTTDYLHYRPLDIDIWYPASTSASDSVLLFRDILGLLDKRANYYTASTAGDGLSQQIATFFCDGFKCSDTNKLLNFKTKSFKNATAVEKKFPLVIYLAAFNGMSYENYALFEELAAKGFVVVSISSIGRYPGDMTMKYEDLTEQVNDAVASLNILKQYSSIDFDKIGIVGYSWGGLAGSLLANKIPNLSCLISLDGSEFHHYGKERNENTDFNNIRNSPDFKTMRIAAPYLRLESSPVSNAAKEDSVYNFSEKLSTNQQIFKIDSAQHEDFGCLSQVVRASGNCKSNQHFETISKLTLSFLDDHLNNGTAFSQNIAQEINKTIRKK